MIRINLLGVPRPKKGKRAAAVSSGVGGGPSILAVAAVLALIAIGGNYWYYSQLDKDHQALQASLRREEDRNRRLTDIKVKVLELEKQKDQYEHRSQVLSQLQKEQSGPSELLTTIASTVNSSDAVWLNSMKDEGNNINLEGVALSVDAVAEFMTNLKKSGIFKSVEIKESFQDNAVKNLQAFNFSLTCEKLAPQGQTAPAAPQPTPTAKKS